MLCKVESINECDDIPIDDMDKDRLDSQVREVVFKEMHSLNPLLVTNYNYLHK